MDKNTILHKLQAFKKAHTKYPIKSIYLFGSYARSEQHKDSDIDLFVEFDREIHLFDFMDLKSDLELFLGKRVDLTTKRALNKHIRDKILEEALLAA